MVEGASAQILAEHAAIVVSDVPLQLPSDPIYEEHDDVVPVYEEQGPNTLVQPYPVVKQPAKKLLHPVFVFVLAGASVQARALHAAEPAVVLAVQGPSDPIRPVQP